MEQNKVVVTGGTGLLGSHLLLKLVQDGIEPIALKRPGSSLIAVREVFGYFLKDIKVLADHFDRITWLDADLCDQEELLGILKPDGKEPVQQVYHCAAMVSFQPSDRKRMIEFNHRSTEALVNACMAAGGVRLLHVSSIAAIGRPVDDSPADETLVWAETETSSGYAKSKFLSEMEVWRAHEEGLSTVIVNPGIILGMGFWDRGSSQLFSRVGKGLRFGTPGSSGYIGVGDVVGAMHALMNTGIEGKRFILVEGSYSYLQIFTMIARCLHVPSRFRELSPAALRWLERADRILGIFSGRRRITREQVQSAHRQSRYSSERYLETGLGSFTPIEQVIKETAACYRKSS